jgi:hypothetical protein
MIPAPICGTSATKSVSASAVSATDHPNDQSSADGDGCTIS